MNYVYMLRCGDGSLYTGWTNDLEKRFRAHAAGRGAKYTRSHLPVTLVWWEAHAEPGEAMRREWAIKHLSRAEKLKLVKEGERRETHPEV
ncbi:MAG: GIY-YIG nuclease family protein [Oscillospiraceae bacterium]|nr:GIY-YIG nuclease family protein [Oscillospiraceae bacterium]